MNTEELKKKWRRYHASGAHAVATLEEVETLIGRMEEAEHKLNELFRVADESRRLTQRYDQCHDVDIVEVLAAEDKLFATIEQLRPAMEGKHE